MRALVFDQSLHLDTRRPRPPEAMGDTLLRIRRAGICATDLEIVHGYMGFSGVLGHEFVGEVVASPSAQLVGRRVVGEINVVCGRCDMCVAGFSAHCRARTVLGILNHDGVFADYARLPAANLHVLPDSVDEDAAVFVEPLAAAFQILKQISIEQRHRVTVLGDGRLGLLVGQVLRDTQCQLRLIGKHPEKLALGRGWGIETRLLADVEPRQDQDVVVDCTGSAAGIELALRLVRPRGIVVLKSTIANPKPLQLAPVVIDEIQIIGSRCGPFPEAIAALAEKRIDVSSLIHQRISLDRAPEAMEIAARPGVLKVLLTMD